MPVDPEDTAEQANALIRWSRSHHASSVVAGVGLAVCAFLWWADAGEVVALSAGAAIILIFVPIANSIHE